MYDPCVNCALRRGYGYTKDCDNTCAYANAMKSSNSGLDRQTALHVLQDLSSNMYPNYDLFGTKTLVINRDKFEVIRAKYLDRKD